jgi:hypothetical protein
VTDRVRVVIAVGLLLATLASLCPPMEWHGPERIDPVSRRWVWEPTPPGYDFRINWSRLAAELVAIATATAGLSLACGLLRRGGSQQGL